MFERSRYKNERFDSFMDVLRTFLREAGLEKPPLLACLAVAGVAGDFAHFCYVCRWWITPRGL